MMLRDAQRNNRAISGALFGGLAVSVMIVNAAVHVHVHVHVHVIAITIRAGARAIAQRGPSK